MTCEKRCVVTEPTEIPTNNMPPPSGGGGGGDFNGITKANTPTVTLTGDGKNTPLRATVNPFPINYEMTLSVLTGWGNNQALLAYPVGIPCTLEAGLPGFHGYARNVQQATGIRLSKVTGGTPTQIGSIAIDTNENFAVTFAADVSFTVNDTLLIEATSDAAFDIVAMTIIGLRDLAIAA